MKELKNKRNIRLLAFEKKVPDHLQKFTNRFVYSCLAQYTGQYDPPRPLLVTEIADLTRLDRRKCVPKAVAHLEECGLAEKQSRKWSAVEHTHILRHAKTKHVVVKWPLKYAAINIYLPSESCLLTARQNAVFWFLYCKQGKWITEKGIAKYLSISRETVHNSIMRLLKLGLLNRLKPQLDGCLDWWQDQKRTVTVANSDWNVLDYVVIPDNEDHAKSVKFIRKSIASLSSQMLADHWTQQEIVDFWNDAKQAVKTYPALDEFCYYLGDAWTQIKAETDKNRQLQGFRGRSCRGLLTKEVRRLYDFAKATAV